MLSSMSLAQFWIYLCPARPILEARLVIRPRSPPPHVVLMHSKWAPLSRKHVRSIAIWRSTPQSVVTIKASWGKEPLQINFTLFHHPWTPSECRMVLGDGCRELGFGFCCSLTEKWTLRAKRWTTHVLTWRLTPGTLQCRFHSNKRQHRHQQPSSPTESFNRVDDLLYEQLVVLQDIPGTNKVQRKLNIPTIILTTLKLPYCQKLGKFGNGNRTRMKLLRFNSDDSAPKSWW